MNTRTAALAIVAAFIMLAFVPAADTDSLSKSDYGITIPGTEAPDTPIELSMKNGDSASWTVYVVNLSDKYLDVSFRVSGVNEDIYLASVPEDTLIAPNESGYSALTSGTVTIQSSLTSESYSQFPIILKIHVTDISDKKSTTTSEIVFKVSVDSSYSTDGQYNKFFGIFPNTLSEPFNGTWFTVLVTILVLVLCVFFISRLLVPAVLNFIGEKYTGGQPEVLSKSIETMLVIITTMASLVLSMQIIGASTDSVATVKLISSVVYIAVLAIVLWKVYMFAVKTLLDRADSKDEYGLDMTLLPLFGMIGKIIFWVAGASAVLGCFGVDLKGILVSAGVISLGITLGAQNVLSQFFSGMVLLMTRPFVKDDFVKINNEIYIVRNVKLMFTEFYNWDKDQIITMPNNVITATTLSNLSKGDSSIRLFVYYSVAYEADVAKAEKVILEVAGKSKYLAKNRDAPNVRLTKFDSSGIELRLGMYVVNYDCTSAAASQLRMDVYQAFLENGIEVPYEKVEVFLKSPCDGRKRPDDTIED